MTRANAHFRDRKWLIRQTSPSPDKLYKLGYVLILSQMLNAVLRVIILQGSMARDTTYETGHN